MLLHRGLACCTVLWVVGRAGATIVGLNQIPTPEIQPTGTLALSAQVQHPRIGNRQEVQFELGLSPRFEVAWFQGLAPGEGLLSVEASLLSRGPHLLTAGALNWSTRAGDPAPVIEYGYYPKNDHFVVGAIRPQHRLEAMLGYRHAFSERLAFSADYQSGPGNAVTVGLTFNFTASLSLNPALYRTNTSPHRVLGYAVLTWNLPLWK